MIGLLRKWKQSHDYVDRHIAAKDGEIRALRRRAQEAERLVEMLTRDRDELLAASLAIEGGSLEVLAKHKNWELSYGVHDGDDTEPGCWHVHKVNGGRNDREWTLIGSGDTPEFAIAQAAAREEGQ